MSDQFLCPIPWVSLSMGAKNTPRLCCHQGQYEQTKVNSFQEASSLKHTEEARRKMLKGEVPAECMSCLALEKSGCKSPRLDYLERFEFNENGPVEIKYLDITVDNDCNLECMMCSPLYSQKLSPFFEKQLGAPKVEAWTSLLTSDDIKELIPSLEQITLTGGEPFLSPKTVQFISNLASSEKASDLVFRVFSNFTHFNSTLLKSLEKLKRLELIMSIDSVGENYEMIRFPAKWERVTANIEALKSMKLKNLDLHLHSVISAMNWNSLGDLIRFFQKSVPSHNILPVFVEIEAPVILHPRVLPESQFQRGKEDILKALADLTPVNGSQRKELEDFKNLIAKIEAITHQEKFVDYQIFLQKVKNFRNRRLTHA